MSADPEHTNKTLTDDPTTVFEAAWKDHGIDAVKEPKGTDKGVTPVYNKGSFLERLKAGRAELDQQADEYEEMGRKDLAEDLRNAPVYKGMAKRALLSASATDSDEGVTKDALNEMRQKGVIDSNVAERSTPLVFDADIRALLKASAPLAQGRWARQGQEGYEIVFNRIDRRESPLGRVPESISRRLQDYARDFGLNRETEPMRIYADTAEIGDFAATASAHYMDLEDLTISARLAEYAQFDEQEMMYGRYELDGLDTSPVGGDAGEFDYEPLAGTTTPLEGGSPVGQYAARGFAEWCRLADEAANTVSEIPDTDHHIDKSGTTTDFLDDLKAEVTAILQGPYDSLKPELEIWTSESMYDVLENEFIPRARSNENDDELNYGDYTIRVKGVPVYTSHNIDEHTYVAQDEDGDIQDPWDFYESGDADYAERTVGSEGDVAIVNTSTWRKRELSPLSTFPLAVRGGADEVGMLAYDGNVELSGGFFGRFLSDYGI
jgi:hypothetical protein